MAATGTATYTEEISGSVKLVTCDWTSAASGGSVTENASTKYYTGKVIYAAFEPGATTPSDNYDVTVLDKNSNDILNGLGVDRSNAATVYVDEYDGLGAVANSQITVTVANAGNSKTGSVYLWIR